MLGGSQDLPPSSNGWLRSAADVAAEAWLAVMQRVHGALMPHLISLTVGATGAVFIYSMGRLMYGVRDVQRRYEAQQLREAEGNGKETGEGDAGPTQATTGKPRLLLLAGTQKGTCLHFASKLAARAKVAGLQPEVVNVKDYEVESLASERLAVVIISTYADAKPPESAAWFCRWLDESATDFRVGAGMLQDMRYAVFGCGNQLYGDNFNTVGKAVDARISAMGARQLLPVGLGNEDSNDMEAQFDEWCHRLLAAMQSQEGLGKVYNQAPVAAAGGGEGSDDEEEGEGDGEVPDIEDMGGMASAAEAPKARKEMLTPMLRASLSKQGYKLIGSHSGVKMCRWTKSMLRGRGGCYKHSFYGIESHRCMEATPSLACANKCVFCWRHHSNPVGKEWKWEMDEPDVIVKQAVESHVKMVREFRGVPGVKPERFKEGLKPAHCALSLVGEPIMYPRINDLVSELHSRGMSTFLVTNAQFPDAMRAMKPVTQMYVSIDAATKESLKAVDRPLFADFWERFLECLTILREFGQRTVYRLTLVSGWNMNEVDKYAELLNLGEPDFIEIKGVTYCGSSGASSLTMKNVPYHDEVCAFGEAICGASGGRYALACEHAHSCCILLARVDRFLIDGIWHTWIDYARFQELVAQGQPFTAADYMAPTPLWAVYGAPEAGFDPKEERFRKVRNHPASSSDADSLVA